MFLPTHHWRAMREGTQQRSAPAELKSTPAAQHWEIYVRKGRDGAPRRCGAGEGGANAMAVLRLGRSWLLQYCAASARRGLGGTIKARAARGNTAAEVQCQPRRTGSRRPDARESRSGIRPRLCYSR